MKDSKPIDATEMQQKQLLTRAARTRTRGSRLLPSESFNARKAYFVDKDKGLLAKKPKKAQKKAHGPHGHDGRHEGEHALHGAEHAHDDSYQLLLFGFCAREGAVPGHAALQADAPARGRSGDLGYVLRVVVVVVFFTDVWIARVSEGGIGRGSRRVGCQQRDADADGHGHGGRWSAGLRRGPGLQAREGGAADGAAFLGLGGCGAAAVRGGGRGAGAERCSW